MKKITFKKLKQTKGITLIALVITIIVLLILAGVTIATLTGDNGILTKTQNAKTQNAKMTVEEQINLALQASRINKDVAIDKDILENELKNTYGMQVETGENKEFPWTVTSGSFKYQIQEDGTVEKVNGIVLSKTEIKMVQGQEPVTITASKTEGVEGEISWTSDNESIATVSNGTITAVGSSGTAIIKAKINGTDYSAECKVTIVAKVTNIKIEPSTIEIEQGNSKSLTITTTPSGENVEELEYISSDTTGKITVDKTGKVTVASDATVGGTATITVKSSEASASCTITIKQAKLPIGEYVEYNVTYTDMYSDTDAETSGAQGYQFTQTDGWRILDVGTKNADGSYSGAKIISTGVPAKLHYNGSIAYNGSTISNSNVPTWWGTVEQVRTLYGDTYADAGYIYESKGYPKFFATAGLLKNFESIPFEAKTNNLTPNKGGYAAINNGKAATGDITGTIFKTGKASEVHNVTLAEINKAEGSTTRSSVTSDLFYLRRLNKYGYSTSVSPDYWLATPFDGRLQI